ncbi:MAG: nuclear transport factor 2 family protein [Candidatus Acidiferrum sp.]
MHDEAMKAMYEAMYKAFNDRDIDAVLATMHRDVDWPNGMEGGRVHGHEGVRAYWTRQWSMINPKVYPVNVSEDELGRIVVDVHQLVRNLEGIVVLDQMVRHVYVMESGLIKSMEILEAPSTALSPKQ